MRILNADFIPRVAWEGTAIPLVITPTLAVILETVSVRLGALPLNDYVVSDLTLANVAGVLLSLLTVFRTQKAYDRYSQGRGHLGALMGAVVDVAGAGGAFVDSVQEPEAAAATKAELARLLRLYFRLATSFFREASLETKAASSYWRDAEEVREEIRVQLGMRGRLSLERSMEGATEAEKQVLRSASPRARAAVVLRWARGALHKSKPEEPGRGAEAAPMMASVLLVMQRMQPDFNGCAKIATLPFPRAYIQMDRLIRFAYIFSLPILLGSKVGWESVPLVSILSFGFYGLDAVATQLQDPFVSMFGDVALDGKFEDAVCGDIDSLLEKPGNAYTPEDNTDVSPSSAP